MKITCEKCETSFNVADNLIKETGSKLRCSNCKHVFKVYPPAPEEEPAEIEDDEALSFEERAEDAENSDEISSLADKLDDLDSSESEEDFSDADLSELEKQTSEIIEDSAVKTATDEQDILAEISDDAENFTLDLDEIEMESSEKEADGESEDILLSDEDAELLKPDELKKLPDESDLDLFVLEMEADTEINLEKPQGKALESDQKEVGALEEIGEDLELDFNFDAEVADKDLEILEKGAEESISGEDFSGLDLSGIDDEGEDTDIKLDLGELEIENENDAGLPSKDGGEESLELELSDDMGAAPEDAGALDDDLDLELDLDDDLEKKDAKSTAEDELELEMMDFEEAASGALDSEKSPKTVAPPKSQEAEKPSKDLDDTLATAPPTAYVEEEKGAGGLKRILIAILAIALLGGGGYFAATQMGFMGGSEKSLPDAGNIKMTMSGINGDFVSNATIGQLFMVKGIVKNEYPDSRAFIKVAAKLYDKEKKLLQTQYVYCGNSLSDSEIKTMAKEAILQRLSSMSGENQSNANVKTGQQVPFMAIFFDLPANLDEFTVEVAESQPAQ